MKLKKIIKIFFLFEKIFLNVYIAKIIMPPKRQKKQKGRNIFKKAWNKAKEVAKNAHDHVKKKKYISKTARALGYNAAGEIAEQAGYNSAVKMKGRGRQPVNEFSIRT